MSALLTNTRFYVLLISFFLSVLFALYSYVIIPFGILQNIRFEQLCGFTSTICLYVSLLIGPFFYQFPHLKGKKEWKHMRRAIGVSAFYFAGLHTYVTFFEQLKGFSGLAFLSSSYIVAIIIGSMSLFILSLLTLTSVDQAVTMMGFRNWKLLHRLTYLSGVLLLIHILMLGTHFSDLSNIFSEILFMAVAFLLFLNAKRFDVFLREKYGFTMQFGLVTSLTLGMLFLIFLLVINPLYSFQNNQVSLGIHSAHIKLAEDAQSGNRNSNSTIPGLDGDRTIRYTASLSAPETITPNEDTTLTFTVFNAGTGSPVVAYKTVYTKPSHLIVVDSSLTSFSHIHPTQVNNGFSITTQFPSSGVYHLYLDFQPYGGIEQQIGFSLTVGEALSEVVTPTQKPDTVTSKEFDGYFVSLDTHGPLSAQAMSLGQQKISFILKDAKTNKPVTTLKPYLGAFGHLVMIREEDYTYLHVHPNTFSLLPDTASGGPTVDFLPIGIYGPFKEGTYRVFAQFNPGGTLILTDFTVKVGK